MVFLDFEGPIAEIHQELEDIKSVGKKRDVDVSKTVGELEERLHAARTTLYTNLKPWQKVQLARHPERPYTLYYIEQICDTFTELHGDRKYGDDKAIVGGFGSMAGQSVMFIGHQKGTDTKSRQYRNFGMASPEGYRKALRLMKLAEKFNKPIVCFIDTPGAYPGIEAEKRGQAQSIANNLFEMVQLQVPIICVVIGEGASGGAIGIGVGDVLLMLENTWYSVISPESCSSILWRSWEHKQKAASQLHLTPEDMQRFGIADQILEEPLGGAHHAPLIMAQKIKESILKHLAQLSSLNAVQLVENRINKYTSIGEYNTK